MSNCVLPSTDNKQRRVFSPVILFHDHRFVRDGSGDLEHVHIPYRDPHYVPSIESSKKRIHQMLEDNGRFWADVMVACSKADATADKPLSPVPSLVSSSSPASLTPREPPAEWNRIVPSSSTSSSSSSSPPPQQQQQQQQPSSSTATTNTTSTLAAAAAAERRPYQRRSHPPTMHVARQKRAKKAAPVIQTGQLNLHHNHHSPNHHHHPQKRSSSNNNSSSHGIQIKQTTTTTTTTAQVVKKRQRSNLPKPVTAILKTWLTEHKEHPYPNEDEKIALVKKTGLARNQISNWFINARRRILRPMLADEVLPDDHDDEDYEDHHHQHHHHHHQDYDGFAASSSYNNNTTTTTTRRASRTTSTTS